MRLPMPFLRPGAIALLASTLGATGGCGGPKPNSFAEPVGGDDASSSSSSGGMTFSSDGGASSGTPLGGASCATGSSEAQRQPVYLLFVLDGSGSMNQDNKWTAVVPALQSIFAQMASTGDTGIGAGLIVFSDSNDPTTGSGPYPSSADVPIALVDAAHLSSLGMRLAGMPQNGTPTHAALTGGYGELEPYSPAAPLQPGGKKVLVLITDGVPTDDCASVPLLTNYATNACIVQAGNELMLGPPKGPIETFVIGVGDFSSGSFFGLGGIDPTFLGNLAHAGGTGSSNCNPNETASTSDLCYFEIDPSMAPTAAQLQQQFETALNAIRGQVISCTYPLQGSQLGNVDPSLVNVEVDGKTILQDAKNGWTYDNPKAPTQIILHGAACSTAQANIMAKVSIVLGCATQTK
jgi:von Willebrand factor type A domain